MQLLTYSPYVISSDVTVLISWSVRLVVRIDDGQQRLQLFDAQRVDVTGSYRVRTFPHLLHKLHSANDNNINRALYPLKAFARG